MGLFSVRKLLAKPPVYQRSIAPLHGDGQTETEVSRQVSCGLCSHKVYVGLRKPNSAALRGAVH